MQRAEESTKPRANVLGVGISAVNMAEAIETSDHLLQERGKGYICLTGVHGVMESRRDQCLRQILNRSFLCLPDGMPTVWVGHAQGHRTMRRVYGHDFMLQFCRQSAKRSYRHFLYGGNRGVAERLKARLEILIPAINIVGLYTPPFRPLTPSEEMELMQLVNQTQPDIIWVGLSTPKQERFMAQYFERLKVGLMIGVGAAFDIHAGILADAPDWMKACGLQWLDRLLKEPRRLWRRYLTNNPRFLWDIGLQLSGLKRFEMN